MRLPLLGFIVACMFIILYACSGEGSIDCEDAIPWQEARDHVGERATVQGEVTEVQIPNPNLDENFEPDPRRLWIAGGLVAVFIRPENEENFVGSEITTTYERKTVCVRGKIQDYGKGRVIIEIDSPDDIAIAE